MSIVQLMQQWREGKAAVVEGYGVGGAAYQRFNKTFNGLSHADGFSGSNRVDSWKNHLQTTKLSVWYR